MLGAPAEKDDAAAVKRKLSREDSLNRRSTLSPIYSVSNLPVQRVRMPRVVQMRKVNLNRRVSEHLANDLRLLTD